jgi:hypothetical protein
MSEDKVRAALEAARIKAETARAAHPGIANPNMGQELEQDEDDVPVYSVRQVERLLAQASTGVSTAPAAAAPVGGIQTASYDALVREVERRKAEAKDKLANIATDLLELELARRKGNA